MTDTTTAVEIRVWWIPQVPMQAFEFDVPDIDTGLLFLDVLAKYDLFQLEHHVKPDFSNAGGVKYRFRDAVDPANDDATEDDWEYVDEDDEDDVAHHRQCISEALGDDPLARARGVATWIVNNADTEGERHSALLIIDALDAPGSVSIKQIVERIPANLIVDDQGRN